MLCVDMRRVRGSEFGRCGWDFSCGRVKLAWGLVLYAGWEYGQESVVRILGVVVAICHVEESFKLAWNFGVVCQAGVGSVRGLELGRCSWSVVMWLEFLIWESSRWLGVLVFGVGWEYGQGFGVLVWALWLEFLMWKKGPSWLGIWVLYVGRRRVRGSESGRGGCLMWKGSSWLGVLLLAAGWEQGVSQGLRAWALWLERCHVV